MKPEISYLIATKNRGTVLRETLGSLIKQDIEDWEAIIVDDHGTDNTKDIVENFSDNRFKYIKLSEKHGAGASSARNLAAVYAEADIVGILDSDDIVYPNRSRVTATAFREDSQADVFYADMDVWEEKTGIVRDRNIPLYPFSLEKIKEIHFISHPTVAFKKQILLDNPYNQFFFLAEDYELLTRLAVMGKKFIYRNEKIMKYRISGDNISIGKERTDLAKEYLLLVKIIRGWIPFDREILNDISRKERKR